MTDEPKLDLSGLYQIGMVVEDLDRSLERYWHVLGVGPWRVYTFEQSMARETSYRGRPGNFKMRIAVAQMGPWTLELIQPLEGESIYREHLDRAGGGVQHMGIRVDNLEEAVRQAEAMGFQVIQSARGHGLHGDGGWAYLDTEKEFGVILELIEKPAERKPVEGRYPPE